MNVSKIWVKFGILERRRYKPVHQLAEILGTERSRALLKAHILTGRDVTSKIGSKTAAFEACPENYLQDFGEEFHDYHFQMAEKYLVKVIEPNIAAESFDDLRYVIYTIRKTTFSKLPPTSAAIKEHLLRAYCFINISFNILDTTKAKLQPVNFAWKFFNGMLIPEQFLREMPKEFLVTCACKERCSNRCSCKREEQVCTECCQCQNCQNL